MFVVKKKMWCCMLSVPGLHCVEKAYNLILHNLLSAIFILKLFPLLSTPVYLKH